MTLDERNDKVNEVLATQYSQLNASIEAFEEHLRSMALGRNVKCVYHKWEVEDANGPVCDGFRLLGMVKLNGQWRLCHAVHYVTFSGEEGDVEWKPLVESSLEDRLWACKHLTKLREAVVESKEKLVPMLEEAIGAIAAALPGPVRKKK